MQIFGTSINLELGCLRLRWSFALDDRATDGSLTRIEDMPRLELTKQD